MWTLPIHDTHLKAISNYQVLLYWQLLYVHYSPHLNINRVYILMMRKHGRTTSCVSRSSYWFNDLTIYTFSFSLWNSFWSIFPFDSIPYSFWSVLWIWVLIWLLTMAKRQDFTDALRRLQMDLISHFDSKIGELSPHLSPWLGLFKPSVSRFLTLKAGLVLMKTTWLTWRPVSRLWRATTLLRDKVDDLENRSRSFNLRFLRIPERAEGTDPVDFIRRLILKLFGGDKFPAPPVINALWIPTSTSPNSKTGNRPMLVTFRNIQDKVKILRFAREKQELQLDGARFSIYPDYSATLLEKRRRYEYDTIKRKLRERKIQYSLQYPLYLGSTSTGKLRCFAVLWRLKCSSKTCPSDLADMVTSLLFFPPPCDWSKWYFFFSFFFAGLKTLYSVPK